MFMETSWKIVSQINEIMKESTVVNRTKSLCECQIQYNTTQKINVGQIIGHIALIICVTVILDYCP